MPREVAAYEQTLAAVRTGLGEEAFVNAWATGHAMSLAQVVDYTLTELDHRHRVLDVEQGRSLPTT